MRKRFAMLLLSGLIIPASLISLLLIALFSSPAQAALGDFLYKFGSEYNFQNPYGISVDSSGNVYVADSINNRVLILSNSGTVLRTWGSFGSSDGQFSYPMGIAVDSSGNVYVADTQNSRVQVFSSTGTFLKKWGSYGSGDGQFIAGPNGIVVDSSGNVYVDEATNHRVQVFSSTGTFLRKWGTYGPGDGQFYYPSGIALDTNGNVYVVDSWNSKVQLFNDMGILLNAWGISGFGDGQLYYPNGIAIDSCGNVYVGDTANHRMQVFSKTGTFLGKWGSYGSGDGQFQWPRGIAFDSSGKVFVVDSGLNRVQVFEGLSSCTPTVTVTQPPVTTSMISGTAGTNDWYVSEVGILLTATDEDSGVKEIHYQVDRGIEITVSGSSASINLTMDGSHSVTYYGVDNAGNIEATHTITVKIDTTPPNADLTISPSVIWPPNHKMRDLLVDGSALDTTSGVASIVITVTDEYGIYNMTVPRFGSTVQLEAWREGSDMDGRDYTITSVVVDNAGNMSTVKRTVLVPHDMI